MLKCFFPCWMFIKGFIIYKEEDEYLIMCPIYSNFTSIDWMEKNSLFLFSHLHCNLSISKQCYLKHNLVPNGIHLKKIMNSNIYVNHEFTKERKVRWNLFVHPSQWSNEFHPMYVPYSTPCVHDGETLCLWILILWSLIGLWGFKCKTWP
jgi:hypothetical protein